MGNSRKTAEIEYENNESAKEAINQFNNTDIGGQNILVQYARRHWNGLRLGRRRDDNRNFRQY